MDTPNHSDVTPDPIRAYADEAVALLAHVDSVEDHLDDLTRDVERSRNGAIADAHKEIGSALKQADIYATLAIAEAIDKLRASQIAEIDRNARAYGWEIGRGQSPAFQITTTRGNPWVRDIEAGDPAR